MRLERLRPTIDAVQVLGGVGAALRRLREQARISQQELAQRSGVGFAQLSRYEREEQLPRLDTLDSILAGLGISLHDLAAALDEVAGRAAPRPLPGAPDRAAERLRQMVAAFPGEERQERAADAFLRIMDSLASAGDMLVRPNPPTDVNRNS